MTLFILAFLTGTLLGTALAKHPRTSGLFLVEKPQQPLLSADATKLEEWKKIFRETVISADGGMTPEMEDFLLGKEEQAKAREDALMKRLLTEAREQAKRELDELLSDNGTKMRPLLEGDALRAHLVDMDVSKTPLERGAVVRRWHAKGFRFSPEQRAGLLRRAEDEVTRNSWRKMFDEQDVPLPEKKIEPASST